MIGVKNSTKNNLMNLVNHNDAHFECRTRLFKTILLLALTQHPFGFHDEVQNQNRQFEGCYI